MIKKYWKKPAKDKLNLDAGVTNADRIRAMSDEELAVEIVRRNYNPPCAMCVPKMRTLDHCDGRCTSGVTKWLQQPAKETNL